MALRTISKLPPNDPNLVPGLMTLVWIEIDQADLEKVVSEAIAKCKMFFSSFKKVCGNLSLLCGRHIGFRENLKLCLNDLLTLLDPP